MSLTNKHYAHLETITQNILGIIAGLIILRLFNIPFSDSIQLQVIFFVVIYPLERKHRGLARGYKRLI